MTTDDSTRSLDFIREIVTDDCRTGKWDGRVQTRFPPEPNGYLHIGHAKAICLNFAIAAEFGGKCNLRFDDTNPVKEEQEYIDSIKEDIRWLGFDWEDREYYGYDYFDQFYEWAIQLIKAGKAYVCDLSGEEVREHRGTLTEPGKDSPYRDRPVDESLDLFERMRAGEFPNGSRTLRAKIDMAHPNLNMRDPVMYRILHAAHPQVGYVPPAPRAAVPRHTPGTPVQARVPHRHQRFDVHARAPGSDQRDSGSVSEGRHRRPAVGHRVRRRSPGCLPGKRQQGRTHVHQLFQAEGARRHGLRAGAREGPGARA